jgi:hypothetical protein
MIRSGRGRRILKRRVGVSTAGTSARGRERRLLLQTRQALHPTLLELHARAPGPGIIHIQPEFLVYLFQLIDEVLEVLDFGPHSVESN